MAYLGVATHRERIASARSTGGGFYKAVVIYRAHAPGERRFDRTYVVSRKRWATREEAIACAARFLAANP